MRLLSALVLSSSHPITLWNYPTTSTFGQTGDKKFSVNFEFDLNTYVKITEN